MLRKNRMVCKAAVGLVPDLQKYLTRYFCRSSCDETTLFSTSTMQRACVASQSAAMPARVHMEASVAFSDVALSAEASVVRSQSAMGSSITGGRCPRHSSCCSTAAELDAQPSL